MQLSSVYYDQLGAKKKEARTELSWWKDIIKSYRLIFQQFTRNVQVFIILLNAITAIIVYRLIIDAAVMVHSKHKGINDLPRTVIERRLLLIFIVVEKNCSAIQNIGQSINRYYSMITLERIDFRQAILGFIKWVSKLTRF